MGAFAIPRRAPAPLDFWKVNRDMLDKLLENLILLPPPPTPTTFSVCISDVPSDESALIFPKLFHLVSGECAVVVSINLKDLVD